MNSANASAALHVKSAGTGHTAVFESETSSNASVYATTEAGYGVWAKAGQYGAPIYGEITGADNLLASIIGKSAGSGSAGYFEATNTTKNTNAIYAKQTGAGTGLEAEIDNSANTKNAVHATTNGAGSAGYFKTTATNGDSATVMAVSHSYSSSAGQFENRTGNDAVVYLGGPLAGGDFQRFHGGQWPEYRVTLAEVSTAARFTNSSGNASVTMVYADTVAAAFTGLVDIVGDLWVRGGTLYKMAGAFAIDHPLDPANKILRHSFVESPEMTNIYKGRATLVNGEAVIELPDYFDALNHPEGREITLTSINGWSPLYMDGKIENNRCTVKTTEQGSLDQEFSWVIYGVRNDTYAREHPIIVEQEKGAEGLLKKGEYLSKPPKPGPQN